MLNKVASFTIALALTGCAVQQKVYTSAVFDRAQAEAQIQPGNNIITGSALMRQLNGGTITCAGTDVDAIPATDYARERMELIYGNSQGGYASYAKVSSLKINEGYKADGYAETMLKAQCDAQGYFKFDKVKDGVYFVTTHILWKANQYVVEGGGLMQKVEVRNGETKNIVLAPK